MGKILKIHNLTVAIRFVFEEDGKYYTQIFLDECLYKLQKCCNTIRVDVVSEGIDINKTDMSKGFMLCHYSYFKDVYYKFEPHVCNGYHDILMIAYELQNICNIEYKRCWL